MGQKVGQKVMQGSLSEGGRWRWAEPSFKVFANFHSAASTLTTGNFELFM